jgi:GTP cyclohydrolase I
MNNGNGNHDCQHLALDRSGWGPEVNPLTPPLPSLAITPARDPLEEIVRLLLVELGVNVNSEHFRDTPARVARVYRDFTRGYSARPQDILKTFGSKTNGLVVVSHIDFFSLCPHHLLVYGGVIHLAYVPNGKIVGVSKIPRLVQALAARPVVQETLVTDIADAFMSVVEPQGCAVKAIGRHDCVAARGVRSVSTVVTAVVKRGVFEEKDSLCREFDQAIAEGANYGQ